MTGLTGNNAITGAGYRTNQPPYEIDQSLRFNDGDSAYLSRTPSSAGNRKTWTWSGWVKKTDNGVSGWQALWSAWSGTGTTSDGIWFDNNDLLYFHFGGSSYTAQVFRDTSSWYHFVFVLDTTESTNTNRFKIWVNGEQITSFGTTSWPSLDSQHGINNTVNHSLGVKIVDSTSYMSMYLAEVNFIDGQALTPASFGETNNNNQWVPIEYVGSYGTNGFYLPFSSTELADSFSDVSGNAPIVEAFTSTGSNTWTCPTGVTSIELLVVAGGGGGGGESGSGGGGGGVVHDTAYSVTPGVTYDITVGAGGGEGGQWGHIIGANGGNSVFNVNAEGSGSTITAIGGGSGAGRANNAGRDGGSGGCGDGSGADGSTTQETLGTATGGTITAYGEDAPGGVQGGGAGEQGDGSGKYFATFASYGLSGVFGAGAGRTSGSGQNDAADGAANTGNAGEGANRAGQSAYGGNGGTGVVLLSYTGNHTITANGDVAHSRAQKKIGSSSIKFDGTGDYLSIPDSDDWDVTGTKATFEFWVNPTSYPGSGVTVLMGQDFGSDWSIYYYNSGSDQGKLGVGRAGVVELNSGSGRLTGVGNWDHVAVVKEAATASSLTKIYINGVEQNSGTGEYFDASSNALVIGNVDSGSNDPNAYMDEIRISNTDRYTSNFTPSTTAFTTDANTKLLIHSDFDGGIGADSSGNINDFSATNLVATDQVIDSPTNNFATINPLDAGGSNNTFSEGNLKYVVAAQNTNEESTATIGFSSGKWYWEHYLISTTTSAGYFKVGLKSDDGSNYWNVRGSDGEKDNNGTTASSSVSYTTTNVVGVAVDMDNGKWWVSVNGTFVGDPVAGSGELHSNLSGTVLPYILNAGSGGTHTGVANFGQDSSFAGNKTSGAAGSDFYYTPPTGFKALNIDNLSDPSIADPTNHFNTVLYTGSDSSADRAITGVGFQPDFVWSKIRSTSFIHLLYDSVRGAGKALRSNATNAEDSDYSTGYLSSFDSDGFSTVAGSTENTRHNYTSQTYAVWNWKAGGTAVSNTDGSITSSVSANTTAGFSIATYTGNNTAEATIGHGLSQRPDLVIVKDRDNGSTQWVHNPIGALGSNYYGYFDSGSFTADSSNVFWYTPTSSVVKVSAHSEVNASSTDYVMYCFHSVDGYSKVGSYSGNGSSDGTFIYTGFKPAFLLVKSTAGARHWFMHDNKRDPYNYVRKKLYANLSNAEPADTVQLDFVSNGFKARVNDANWNGSGETYIYLAFAESPFKYSNAR